jgi:bile acid:Na+ symporter, BASS family
MDSAIDQLRIQFEPGSLIVLNIILGILMFGVALDIKVDDFRRLAKAPKGPLLGLCAQFLLLPAATFLLTLVLKPLPSVALGMILIASCPGGNVSNFMTYLARGNTALSVGMTAAASASAVFLTPLNIALYGSLNPHTRPLLQAIDVEPLQILVTVILILGLPLLVGMFVGHRWPALTARVRGPLRVVGGLIFLSFIVIGISKNLNFFTVDILPIFLMVILHNAMALSVGYGIAKLMRVPPRDARAIAIEVGIQNSGLGLVLIFNFFSGVGGMAIVAAWWGVWHIVAGLSLATFWGRRQLPPMPGESEA